jgi:hypothetical protein
MSGLCGELKLSTLTAWKGITQSQEFSVALSLLVLF